VAVLTTAVAMVVVVIPAVAMVAVATPAVATAAVAMAATVADVLHPLQLRHLSKWKLLHQKLPRFRQHQLLTQRLGSLSLAK